MKILGYQNEEGELNLIAIFFILDLKRKSKKIVWVGVFLLKEEDFF